MTPPRQIAFGEMRAAASLMSSVGNDLDGALVLSSSSSQWGFFGRVRGTIYTTSLSHPFF